MDNSTNEIELAELLVGQVEEDHVSSPASETHEVEAGTSGGRALVGASGNKGSNPPASHTHTPNADGAASGGKEGCSIASEASHLEPCTEPTPGSTTAITTHDGENDVESSDDTNNAEEAAEPAGAKSDESPTAHGDRENLCRLDDADKGDEQRHQSDSEEGGSFQQLVRTESAISVDGDFSSAGDPVHSSDAGRSMPGRLGSATMAALETSRVNRCCPRFRASPRRHRKTPERHQGEPKSKKEPSLIAQAEEFDFGQLAFWNYQVDEEVADAPNLEAKVVKVHAFTDEVTNSPTFLYDIQYEPEAHTCVRGRKDVASAPPPSKAHGSCQRGKVVERVPHNFLSTVTPSLPPHPVGTRVLTHRLECSWVNSKTGAKSAIKPTYFSNGKVRHFADRALCCLRGGYEDEPPLGWSADLAADPAQAYFTRPRSCFRKAMVDVVTHHVFEGIVLFLIVLNTILLAAVDTDPRFVDPQTYNPLLSADQGCCEWSVLFSNASAEHIDCIPCPAINLVSGSLELPFVVLYSLEALLKILAMGFFVGRGA